MYKIIHNKKVIDVVKNPYFIKFLPAGHLAFTDKASADGILGSDEETVYSFKPRTGYLEVSIIEIAEEELSRLESLLSSGKTVHADESEVAVAKRKKINNLSAICKSKIIEGFSVRLLDNKVYDFKLTTEDQLNLLAFENQLACGVESFIYHATDQPCKIFSKDDMSSIIAAYRRHIMYHTAYFNAAKQYINSLTDLKEINYFKYGSDISDSVEDLTLKQLIKTGGSFK